MVLFGSLTQRGLTAQTTGVREVEASPRSVTPLQTRLRYTTMIVLPEDEEILDVICGDKDFWVISATHNIAHVKPAKENATTNLNLVTGSGMVYSFLLTEKNGGTAPDLKVYVNADPNAPHGKPKYYSAAQVETLQAQVTEAQAAAQASERRATDTIATYQQQYPTRLQFAYGTLKYEKPFLVRSIWHDGQFTYIKADATELPALYELKDGKPALVNFQVHNGTYVVPKVIDQGYLALGKERVSFSQQGR
jgi:type IV secretion system protein VirB9